jgi:tetratricopeptide (TPR) repeat protein
VKLILAMSAVVALTLVVFWPVRHHEFVAYDDPAFVVEHPVVKQGLTAAGVRWTFNPVNGYSAAGGPLAWVSHMLDVEVFGMRPGPHHLESLALHALNAALLLLVFYRATQQLAPSTCVAALFAVHPLHVESVAWVFERKDVLSTTFWMLTMLQYVGYVRKPGVGRYAGVFLLLTAGLLTKPVLVTMPFVLLLLDVWPLRRVPFAWSERDRWLALCIEKLPLVVPVAAVTYFTIVAQRGIGAIAVGAIPWTLRAENIVLSYATYLWKAIWPAALAVFYPYPSSIPVWKMLASLVALAALSVVAWRAAKRRPYLTVGWLWYAGTLVPMIGLIQVGSHSMADRFTYVPLIGVFIAVVWSVAEIAASRRIAMPIVVGVACATIFAASVAARGQLLVWQNSETLWSHALAVTNGNFRAYAGMAEVVAARGETGRAIDYYKEALRLAPDAAEWYVNLGLLQSGRGEFADAAASFERALALRTGDAETENNLGSMLYRLDRTADAVSHYQRALALKPDYALARRNLGLAYAASGDLAAASRELLEALRRSPNEGRWHFEAAVILLRNNHVPEGVTHLREAVRLSPENQAARDLLAQIGR